jgi:hypothetical protein
MNRCGEFFGEMIVAILSRAASSNWRRRNVILVAHLALLTSPALADIENYETGQVISGTQGIMRGPIASPARRSNSGSCHHDSRR